MKRPLFRLQYELERPYTEEGSDESAKWRASDVENDVVRSLLVQMEGMSYKEITRLFDEPSVSKNPYVMVIPVSTRTPEAMTYRLQQGSPMLVFWMRPLHTVEKLDEVLYTLNCCLNEGTYVCFHSMTAVLRRQLIEKRYPWGVRHVVMAGVYLWHRVCPKLRLTRRLYFDITHGNNRSMNRVELLGRLHRAGFEVVDEQFRQGEFFVISKKKGEPVDDTPPTGSPIIHLHRIGKGGKDIVVHKFRTMYTYSEYLQPYVYQYRHLDKGGKFKDDYRVNSWGRLLRRLWLDELPMLWNLVRGDIKLVGVRPLSRHYFGLYTPEMQALRIRTKPGLLPPFYYEQHSPETIEEVQASERRYLEAYLERPMATDWKYFWGILGNIVFRRKRSK